MTSCSWRGVKFPCCEGFKPVVTNSGICYVFNSLPSNLHLADNTMKQFMFNDSYPKSSRYWSPMNGYPQPDLRKDPRYSTLPRWSSQTGEDLGLSVELRQNMDDWQDLCVGGHQGFKVVVQSPAELPIYTHQALKVPMKRDFKIYLSPITIRTPLDYLHTDHRSRGCLYQGEMKLDNFKIYSITNCVVQCIIDEAITSCGCVGFYAPRNSSVPVCSNNKENLCVRKVVEELVSSRMAIDKDAKQRQGCVCYPVCNELTYDFTSNRNLFFHENESGIYEATDTKQAYSRVSIFYSKLKFLGVRRQAETSFYDFLGNCGGLLSLMTGFSFISGLELVYHLMLRPFCCLMFNKVRNNNLTVVSRPPLRVLAMKHQLRVKDHYFTRS
ncbi:pickpocket protein 28-like [Macrosteles quadrilineatus]|uniref:pickpocket protein 28-like n=1 Tax=Macrosteles quadrilineatus TaxID=74068 RepID=UPI0023E19976|nr:pickpocket protein 28-like [Macrosteles quadrilineatus]